MIFGAIGLTTALACGDKSEKTTEGGGKSPQAGQSSFTTMQFKAMRGEVPANIKAIKTVQIMYEISYDRFVESKEYPPRSKDKKSWDATNSGGFAVMNWSPDGEVRGSYSVVTTAGPNGDFKIIGVIDADGDGVYATYTATKTTNPVKPTTGDDVY